MNIFKLTALLGSIMILLMSSVTIFADSHTSETRGYKSEELRMKHQEIDQYLFEEKDGHFPERGFRVTQTGPVGDYIEIGISPYDEKNAQFLYERFGDELVKVIEGQVSETLTSNSSNGNVQTIALENTEEGSSNSSNTMMYVLTGIILIGIGAFVFRKYQTKSQ